VSGVIVTISAEGELEIISGLVRHEDRAAAKKKKADAANGDADKAPRTLWAVAGRPGGGRAGQGEFRR
jgi:hypothetical protein